jgi:hypothetical protein
VIVRKQHPVFPIGYDFAQRLLASVPPSDVTVALAVMAIMPLVTMLLLAAAVWFLPE